MTTRFASIRSWGYALALLLLLLAALPAAGQTTQYVGVYFDVDDTTATGCDAQGFSGAELRATVTLSVVNTPAPDAQVTALEVEECVDALTDAFGPPQPVWGNGSPPWPVGVGLGVDGSDVIEAYVSRTLFPDAAADIRVGVFSGQGEPAADTMYVTLGGGSEPILIPLGQLIPIPTLSQWMLLALALLLAASALVVLRRRPARMAFTVAFLVLALSAGGAGVAWAACVMDGMIGDWSGDPTLAQDPTADASGQNPDLRAFFAKEDGTVVCLRVDAFVAFNTPPSITDVPDQTIPEDGTTGALPFTIADVEDAATDLVVSATSSNQMLVPDGNLTLGGAGANRTVSVTPVADGNGFTDVTLTVTDTVGAFSSTTFRVTVTSENDPPSISAIGDQGILEDSNTGALAITVDDTETAAGSLTLMGSSSDTSIIPDGNIVFGGSGANRTVTVTPAANANGGPVTITVTVMDGDGGSVPEQFDVTVTPVNDEPSVTLGPDQVVNEDSGPQSVANFASTSPGPANEAGQTVTLGVSNDTNALFSAQPAINSATGELTYTPAANANGSATVTVVAMDNGGTANGGDDTAPGQTFQITVNAVNDPPVADDEVVAATCNILGVVEAAPGETADAGAAKVFRTVTDNVLLGDSDPVEGTVVNIVEASGLPGGTTDSTTPFSITTNQGGSLTLYADGSFIYTPEPGDRGVADSFTYTIQDAEGAQDMATVTLNVGSTCIWFVDNSVSASDDVGTGTSSDPFTSLVDEIGPDSNPDDAEDASIAGDVIYVFEGDSNTGDPYLGGFVAQAGERLLGQGVDLVVDFGGGDETLFTGNPANRPLVDNPAAGGDAVQVTDVTGVEVAGLELDADGNALQVTSATAPAGVDFHDNEIAGSGSEAILISQTVNNASDVRLADNTVSATGNGIDASLTAGSLALVIDGNTGITSDGIGIDLDGTGGDLYVTSICGNTVSGDTVGIGIRADGVVFDAAPLPGGDADFTGDEVGCATATSVGSGANPVGGSAMVLNNVSGDLAFGDLDLFAGGVDAAGLAVSGTGLLNAGAGTGFEITSTSGTVSAADGPAVGIDPTTVGLVFDSVSSTGSSTFGISLVDVAGSFQVTGTTSVSSAGGDGIAVVDSSANVTLSGQLTIAGTGSEGVFLDDLTGDFSAADTTSTITGTTGDAFNSFSSEGNVTYAGSITNTSANSVEIRDHGGAAATTILFSGNIDDDGAGILLDNNDQTAGATINFIGGLDLDTGTNVAFTAINGGTVNVTSGGVSTTADTTTGTLVNIANTTIGASGVTFDSTGKTGGANGILLTNVGGGAFVSDAGSIASQTSRAVDVSGGSGNVTIDNTLSTTAAGRSVEVTGHSGGTVDFNGAITDNGLGIHLDSNTGSILRFDGGMTVDIAGTEEGFNATGGGTVHVTGTNTVDTVDGTGIAVNIIDTTIGSDDVTFRSVSADGAANGIVLDSTGTSGDFAVTGNAGSAVDGSGGLLTNISGDGVELSDVQNVSLDQLNMSSVGGHGVDGERVNGFVATNATYTAMGNADGEDVFSFDRDTFGDNGLVGTALFQNLTITNFAERAIDIVNEGSGTLDLDVLSVSADNNNDTFGEDAIRVQNEGSVNTNALVSGGTYNNLELDVLAYFAQGTGTNTVELTGVTSTNGGGPDNNPNGGGVAVIGSAGSTTTFDINANSMTGVQGSVVQIIGLPGSGQTVTLNGTIGGPNPADANTFSTDLADGLDLDFDGDGAVGSAIAGTILVQNNTIDFDDDGIGVDHRDAGGTMNVTIRDNVMNAILGTDATLDADDGIFIFIDDDVGSNVNALNLEIIDNTVNNLTAGKHVIVVEDVQNGNDVCLSAIGNGNGGGNGDIELDTDAAADLVVDATDAANLSALNNGIAVNEVVVPTYNNSVDCIP